MFSFGLTSLTSPSKRQGGLPSAELLCLLAALCSVAAGSLVLFGWSNGIEVLKRVDLTLVAMNPATAVCFILGGIAIGLNQFGCRAAALGAGTAIATVAAAKLLDIAFGGVPVDRLLFADLLDAGSGFQPNRMAPNTAVAFLLVGIALVCVLGKSRTSQLLSQGLGIAVLLISMFALVGYAFNIDDLSGVGPFNPMAVHTGAGLLMVGFGILCLTRQTGLMLVLNDRGPAGSMARTVLPLAIAIPIAVGAGRLWGQHHGYYGTEAGVALQVIANVVVTSALLVSSILALYRSDCARMEREQALKQSEHFNRTINEASPDCVSLLDVEGKVVFSNEAALRAYGIRSDSDLVGRPWGSRLDPSAAAARDAALAAARAGGVGRITLSLAGAAGELLWFESLVSKLTDAEDQLNRFIVMSRDITEQKRVEQQVRWTASHDAMTQLPNRALFQARLDQLTAEGDRADFALLLLDIDDFKQVNDTLGHDAGDALLTTVGDRLRNAVRPEDFVARLGGDEFAIILEGVRSEAGATSAGAKILESLREPWIYAGRVSDCRVSIGVSIARMHGHASELLKNADIALYAAKMQERGQLALFQPKMRADMQRRSSKISVARHALEEGLIVPFYQPKVDLRNGGLIGFEALLRWRHPTHGIQLPSTIDAAFEDHELAQQLTDRILSQSLADMRRWLDAGVEFGHVAVNLAAADFKQREFAERLLERLDSCSIPRSCLQVEVTETVFLGRGAEYVERALKTLSAGGIRIALDDFGTGYASLSHLKQFPVDIVKIDRSFLEELHKDEHNAAIVRTVVSLGRSLDLDVVAEGVETAVQEDYLISQGCRFAQGYLYGKAMPATRVPGVVRSSVDKSSKAA